MPDESDEGWIKQNWEPPNGPVYVRSYSCDRGSDADLWDGRGGGPLNGPEIICMVKMKLDPYLTSHTKSDSRWTGDINTKGKLENF